MILIIDNYDSFVQILARYFREAGARTVVVRNDAESAGALLATDPRGVVISPGPRAPSQAGVSMKLLEALARDAPALPVFGVCLGHQCMGEFFGGRTVRARRPMHGEAAPVRHDGRELFQGVANPFAAGRYHSLVCDLNGVRGAAPCAWSEEGEIMGLRAERLPWHGVQFHPESLLTPEGRGICARFLAMTAEREALS